MSRRLAIPLSSSSSTADEEDHVPISSLKAASHPTSPTTKTRSASTPVNPKGKQASASKRKTTPVVDDMDKMDSNKRKMKKHDEGSNKPKKEELYPFLFGTLKSGGVLTSLGMDEEMTKRAFEEISASDAKCLDDKWMKRQLKDAKMCFKRAELAMEVTNFFITGVSKSLLRRQTD